MRLTKSSTRIFIGLFGLKIFSSILGVIILYLAMMIFPRVSGMLTWPGFVMSIIVVSIERLPIYLIWVLIFLIFQSYIEKRGSTSFQYNFLIVLFLNFTEQLFLYSHFDRIMQIVSNYGVFHAETWRAFPDFEEVISVLAASIVFAGLCQRIIKGREFRQHK